MPSPVAHSLVSLTLAAPKPEGEPWIKWVGFWVILGNFADFDFFPGILIGNPSQFHHGPTHSILFAFVLAVVAYFLYPVFFRRCETTLWSFLGVSFSHLILDMMTRDTVAPYGLPLFWPFGHTLYRFPFWVFLNMNRGMHLQILFSWHNLIALGIELGITLPLFLWVLSERYDLKVHEKTFYRMGKRRRYR